jgi:rhodanese-related sulfurtransferase
MTTRVGPAEAWALAEKGHAIVDVRSVEEFAGGHPAGAFNVPIAHAGGAPNPSFLAVMERLFTKDRGLVVTCLAGGRSLRAAGVLEGAGFTSVIDQRAGWGGTRDPFGRVTEEGWAKSGLPTSTVAEPGHSWAELEKA